MVLITNGEDISVTVSAKPALRDIPQGRNPGRANQSNFRTALVRRENSRCAVTGRGGNPANPT
ncbi:hypothetical protein BJX70DRAFT_361001 [Aspergillus crustosus]